MNTRTAPDWATVRGYGLILLAFLAAFFFISGVYGTTHIVFALAIYLFTGVAICLFTRADRARRRTPEKGNPP